jgi:glyoxylase-like metal-dependent hydrolase (beta-lactamase superfamily II)
LAIADRPVATLHLPPEGPGVDLANMIRLTSVAFVVCGTIAWSQPPTMVTEESYVHARHVAELGIEALGGLGNLQAVEDIYFTSSARVPEEGQSANPDAEYYLRPVQSAGALDLIHRRSYLARQTHYLGSGPRGSSVVTTGNTGFTVDLRSNAMYPLAPAAVAANYRSVQRAFPFLLVEQAITRAGTLRWLGDEQYGGRTLHVISFVDSDGSQITLCFDSQTGLLTKTEGLVDTFLKGLAAAETVFSDYRAVNNVQMPFHVVTRVGGEVTSDATYGEIALNTRPDTSRFIVPKDAVLGPEVGGAVQPLTLTTLGKDVYFVDAIGTGGIFFYSAMFVVFDDYVLVLESPLSDGVSQAVIGKIKETAPGKPIRYLVPTHYHTDHLGGLRGYIAEGTTIVTTPGNVKFIEHLASIAHPLNPDRLSLHPRPVSIEAFKARRTFTDGAHRVELYDVGPTSHVDEMVIAYLPLQKLVFVSDLFLVSYKGRLGPAESGNVLLLDKIRTLGLHVETIAGGHGRIGTIDELRQVVAEQPAQSVAP